MIPPHGDIIVGNAIVDDTTTRRYHPGVVLLLMVHGGGDVGERERCKGGCVDAGGRGDGGAREVAKMAVHGW